MRMLTVFDLFINFISENLRLKSIVTFACQKYLYRIKNPLSIRRHANFYIEKEL